MRPIRFRARDFATGKWYIGALNPSKAEINLPTFFANIQVGAFDVNTLSEFTGLHDSYVKEEYFGDITEDDDGIRRVIEDGCSAVLFKDCKTDAINYFWQLSKPHQVIGNLYENPELAPLERGNERR